MKSNAIKYLSAFFIFTCAAIYITFPLLFHLGNYAVDNADYYLIAWIQNWVIHVIFSENIFSLFNANIYYPYDHTLAFSETFITSALIALPIKLFTVEPIATVNVTLITALLLLGFSIFLLSYYLTKNYFVSIFVGTLVIFSPAVLSYTVHLQVLDIVFMLLSILALIIYIEKNKAKYLLLCLLFFILQVYNSFLPGYFIIFTVIFLLIFKWFDNKKQVKRLFTVPKVIFILVTFLLIIPIALPYYAVSQEFHYVRDIRDTIHFALQPEDLLYPGETTRLKQFLLTTIPTNQYSQNNEFKPGYLGLVFSILVILVLFYSWKFRKKIRWQYKSFLATGLVGLVLSLGPFLHLNRHTIHQPFPIPLPYALFYYILPGFQGFRNSARWEVLFILCFAVLIAIVLSQLLKKVSFNRKVLIHSVLIIGVIAEFNFPMHFEKVPQKENFPQVYTWLSTTPKDAIVIEMPIYTWNMQPYVLTENLREYYSTVDFRKRVNGASGFSPPIWQTMVAQVMSTFPSEYTLKRLKSMKVTYIIVHKSEYDLLSRSHFSVRGIKIIDGVSILQKLENKKSVRLIKRFGDDYVFQLQ